MPLRAKLKKTFSSKKSKSSEEAAPTEIYPPRRSDIEYYEPHEIPKSKYRGRIDPQHQESLNSFTFGNTWTADRRGSMLSGTFSPGGTKSMSRRNSAFAAPALSIVDSDDSRRRMSTCSPGDETVDDTDSLNDASSRTSTSDDNTLAEADNNNDYTPMTLRKVDVFSYKHDTPFTAEELEYAMSHVTLDQQPTALVA